MEAAVVKPSASEVATEALEYLRTGKRKIVFGLPKQPKHKTKNKIKLKYFVMLFLFCLLFCPFLFLEKKYEIKGSVHIGGNFIKNHQMYFLEREGEIKAIYSDELGNFNIKLKKGFYRIYFEKNAPKKYLMPETSPLAIKLSRNLENIRIYVPR